MDIHTAGWRPGQKVTPYPPPGPPLRCGRRSRRARRLPHSNSARLAAGGGGRLAPSDWLRLGASPAALRPSRPAALQSPPDGGGDGRGFLRSAVPRGPAATGPAPI